METNEFIEKFKKSIIMNSEVEITESTLLDDISGWDSLGLIALSTFLEEQFSLVVSVEEMMNLKKFSDILELIKNLKK